MPDHFMEIRRISQEVKPNLLSNIVLHMACLCGSVQAYSYTNCLYGQLLPLHCSLHCSKGDTNLSMIELSLTQTKSSHQFAFRMVLDLSPHSNLPKFRHVYYARFNSVSNKLEKLIDKWRQCVKQRVLIHSYYIASTVGLKDSDPGKCAVAFLNLLPLIL